MSYNIRTVAKLFQIAEFPRKNKYFPLYILSNLLIASLEIIGIASIGAILTQFSANSSNVNFYFFSFETKFQASIFIILFWVLRAAILSVSYRFNFHYLECLKSGLQKALLTKSFQSTSRSSSKESGRLFSALTNEVQMITGQIFMPFANILSEFLLLLLFILIFVFIEPLSILVSLLILLAGYTIIQFVFTPFSKSFGRKRLAYEKEWTESINNLFSLRKEASAFNVIDIAKYFLIDKLTASNKADGKFLSLKPISRSFLEAFGAFSLLAIAILLSTTSNSENVAFITLSLLRLLPSLNKLSIANQSFKFAEPVALKQIESICSSADQLRGSYRPYDIICSETLQCYATENTKPSRIEFDLTNPGLYVIMGASGLGKSTFLDNLSSSMSELFYNNIETKPNSISYSMQDSFILDSNVEDNIKFFRGLDSDYIEEGLSILKSWGFPDDLFNRNLNASNFSGGEKKRISVVRSLVGIQEVVLLDEPTSGLDITAATKVIRTIVEKSSNKLIIVVTHEQLFAAYSSNVITLTK